MRGLLESSFATVVMVADKTSLLESANRLRPDMVVVDLSLADDGDLNWLLTLRQSRPDLKIIVLSVHDEQSVRQAALSAGANAFVLKREIAPNLLNAIDAIRRGENVNVGVTDNA